MDAAAVVVVVGRCLLLCLSEEKEEGNGDEEEEGCLCSTSFVLLHIRGCCCRCCCLSCSSLDLRQNRLNHTQLFPAAHCGCPQRACSTSLRVKDVDVYWGWATSFIILKGCRCLLGLGDFIDHSEGCRCLDARGITTMHTETPTPCCCEVFVLKVVWHITPCLMHYRIFSRPTNQAVDIP